MPSKLTPEEVEAERKKLLRRERRRKRKAQEAKQTKPSKVSRLTPGGAASPRSIRVARESIQEAFELLGGVDQLVIWGEENPDKFYALWGRMIKPEEAPSASAGGLEKLLAKLDKPEPTEQPSSLESMLAAQRGASLN